MRNDWKAYILARSGRYGLDPKAALAVASMEGLSGGVGDGGHAFGPFQLNDAGGVLTNRPGNHRSFAESKQGIDWALQRMSQVGARGKTGNAAINAIVRQFERPANPDKEVSGAIGVYGKYGGKLGGAVSPPNVTGQKGGPSGPPNLSGQPTAAMGQPDMRQAFMSMLMQRGQAMAQDQPDPGMLPALVMLKQMQRQQGQQVQTQPQAKVMPTSPTPATNRRGQGANGVLAAAKGMLGTPYVWGGTTPGQGLDCSGFLQQAYAKAGVRIPRTTYDQVRAGQSVGLNSLAPGDAVFTEPGKSGPNHVGMYIGNGMVQESPHTGDQNKVIPLKSFLSGGFVAARRYVK